MATKTYYLKGEIRWAKIQTPDDKFDIYTLDLYPDSDSWDMFKDSGLQLKVRENSDDGREFIKLRRPTEKKIKGELEKIGPPKCLVQNDEGDWDDFKGLIGNGSTGVCKVRVYDTPKGKGHELDTVAIEELVPFENAVGGEDYPF